MEFLAGEADTGSCSSLISSWVVSAGSWLASWESSYSPVFSVLPLLSKYTTSTFFDWGLYRIVLRRTVIECCSCLHCFMIWLLLPDFLTRLSIFEVDFVMTVGLVDIFVMGGVNEHEGPSADVSFCWGVCCSSFMKSSGWVEVNISNGGVPGESVARLITFTFGDNFSCFFCRVQFSFYCSLMSLNIVVFLSLLILRLLGIVWGLLLSFFCWIRLPRLVLIGELWHLLTIVVVYNSRGESLTFNFCCFLSCCVCLGGCLCCLLGWPLLGFLLKTTF